MILVVHSAPELFSRVDRGIHLAAKPLFGSPGQRQDFSIRQIVADDQEIDVARCHVSRLGNGTIYERNFDALSYGIQCVPQHVGDAERFPYDSAQLLENWAGVARSILA